MMERTTKIFSMILAVCMSVSLCVPAYAAEIPSDLKAGISPISEEVSEFLDNSQTTQTMVICERELIDNMIAEGVITREDLNENLEELASQSENDLRSSGYNEKQISAIMSYEEGEDAYNHIYNSGVTTRSTADADVVFRYGLAGNNTRRQVTIAYDMNWTECPFWTFTDSFGVGWVAADKDSGYLATKIDSSMASVDYFTVNGENAGLYRDVEMDTFSNRAVIGNPILGSANGNYGKHISGILLGDEVQVPFGVASVVDRLAQEFVADLLSALRERQLELKSGPVIFVGGGSILLRKQIQKSGKVSNPLFVEDIRANARGYEVLYKLSQNGR